MNDKLTKSRKTEESQQLTLLAQYFGYLSGCEIKKRKE